MFTRPKRVAPFVSTLTASQVVSTLPWCRGTRLSCRRHRCDEARLVTTAIVRIPAAAAPAPSFIAPSTLVAGGHVAPLRRDRMPGSGTLALFHGSVRRDVHTSTVAAQSNAPTTVAFADLGLCAASLRAITDVKKFEFATAVQDQTLPFIMAGKDVLARAKTGSGKTIAFLLPVIEALLRDAASGATSKDKQISVLVLSPTRELATQIHEEALQLLTFHQGIGAQVVFGGTNFSKDLTNLRSKKCDILIATPGRLIQHLCSYGLCSSGQNRYGLYSYGSKRCDILVATPGRPKQHYDSVVAAFQKRHDSHDDSIIAPRRLIQHLEDGDAEMLRMCQMLVLDEADRLLDMGFKPAIEHTFFSEHLGACRRRTPRGLRRI